MSEHTRLPLISKGTAIHNSDGLRVAVVSSEHMTYKRARELAEFIVRVCNSHDDLVAALENVQWIDEGRSDTGPVLVCPACRHGPKQGHGLDCVIGNAIAKAKG